MAEDWGKESYTALLRRFKNEDGSFKHLVIATDSEFGPSWQARNHSNEDIIVHDKEVDSSKYKDGVFKYKALTNVDHLEVDKQHNGNVFTYLLQSRIYSYHKLKKQYEDKKKQWYSSSSGPVWARLYSTVFWIYVEDDNGERQTHKLVFPWYIYQNEKKTFLQMKKDNDQGIPNANSTQEEQKLLELMAKCWVELISNAQHVIAWSSNAIDITLPLEWFALNPVFQITNDRRIEVLKNMGWTKKLGGYDGDLTLSKTNCSKYIDLSAAFATDKESRKLENVARKLLTRDPSELKKSHTDNAFKLLDFAALDMLFAVAENDMNVSQMLCYSKKEFFNYDKLIFSRYDEVCAQLTERCDEVNDQRTEGTSLLKYNDMDVCLMHELMAISGRNAKLVKTVPFMYDKNGSFKYKLPNQKKNGADDEEEQENPLVFADLHNDVRSALREHGHEAAAAPATELEDHGQEAAAPATELEDHGQEAAAPATELEDHGQEAAAPKIKRRNAGVWGRSNPKVGRANAYLVVTGNGGFSVCTGILYCVLIARTQGPGAAVLEFSHKFDAGSRIKF